MCHFLVTMNSICFGRQSHGSLRITRILFTAQSDSNIITAGSKNIITSSMPVSLARSRNSMD
jgi:hypothetical protein